VHDVELAFAGAGLAPRLQQFAVGRILVHARVAVAVGDIDLAPRRECGVGAAVERLAAHIRRRIAGHAELQQYLPVECHLVHEMAAVIGQEHRVVGRHMDTVRSRILALAP
jgi:hypothetical protein